MSVDHKKKFKVVLRFDSINLSTSYKPDNWATNNWKFKSQGGGGGGGRGI